MPIKTNYKIKIKDYFSLNVYANIRDKIHYILGRIVHKLLSFENVYNVHRSRTEMINIKKTPKEKLVSMLEPKGGYNQSLELDYGGKITDDIIKNTNFYRSNVYYLCAKILKDFIKNNQDEIKNVVQIGCGSYDVINDYLSRTFPEIKFISNDLMIDLEQMHYDTFPNYSNQKNWTCIQGHQIDLLNKDMLPGDFFISKSMLCGHSPGELDELFSLYRSKKVKYMFMSEKWAPKLKSFNFLKLDKPENIEINKPYVNKYFHHNYFEILKKHGFDILSSNIYVIKGNNPKSRFKYNLIILAKNTLIK